MNNFRKELLEIIEQEGYTLSQKFNEDESGSWWKHTYAISKPLFTVHCGETHAKNFKQPVALKGCANVAGTCRLLLYLFINI